MQAMLRLKMGYRGRLVVGGVGFALAVVLCAGAGSAHAASRVIVRPRPAARIRANTVLIVVRAGPEYNDVQARLNGVGVGRDFVRRGENLRVLGASASHGLRPGRNVLRVTARWRGRVRRAVVRFRVVRRILAGAGRDVYVPAGMLRRIVGRLAGGREATVASAVAVDVGGRSAQESLRAARAQASGGRQSISRAAKSGERVAGAAGCSAGDAGPGRAAGGGAAP